MSLERPCVTQTRIISSYDSVSGTLACTCAADISALRRWPMVCSVMAEVILPAVRCNHLPSWCRGGKTEVESVGLMLSLNRGGSGCAGVKDTEGHMNS